MTNLITSRVALIRQPGPRLADGLVTHIERQAVDVDLAHQQWQSCVAAMTSAGWTTIEVAAADECADAVFIEDTAVIFGSRAVIARPGATSRRAETPDVQAALVDLGYAVTAIEAPGTLDGGDVLKVGSTMYIGLGGRTNTEGIAQAAAAFAPDGVEVATVPTTKVLHLKSAITALPDGRIIGYPPVVDDPSLFESFVAMPEESGAHVVDLGDGQLLMAASAPQSIAKVRTLGFEPVVVDICEFEKLEGCVTCLSIRLRNVPTAPNSETSPAGAARSGPAD